MKIHWGFKTYLVISILIFIFQTIPYFFIGKWYGMVHCFIISQILEWLDSLDEWILPMIFASVIASLILGLAIMLLGFILQYALNGKRKKKS